MTGARILLVDDSSAIAQVVVPSLKQAGYSALHAQDANKGFAILKREKIDLLILDIDMPGISGLQMLQLLKQDAATARLPVLMLTVHDDEKLK
ncbi:MAG: response regulator, partial [Elusimicrobia bacterium]|nr:response regulator [Elusimicrobiota bacterium]